MSRGKKILIWVVILLAAIQFIHPAKNISTEISAAKIIAPAEVEQILKTSCNDCHSNNTIYPWYNNIQPVAWLLNHHVDEGKHELNFDEFASYKPRKQYHKMEELEEMVNEDEMPLPSYLLVHKDAVLNAQQKEVLIDWSKSIRADLEAKYPKDSLIIKRPKR
jgi:cytochrome c553